jgi:hypothetical protein
MTELPIETFFTQLVDTFVFSEAGNDPMSAASAVRSGYAIFEKTGLVASSTSEPKLKPTKSCPCSKPTSAPPKAPLSTLPPLHPKRRHSTHSRQMYLLLVHALPPDVPNVGRTGVPVRSITPAFPTRTCREANRTPPPPPPTTK